MVTTSEAVKLDLDEMLKRFQVLPELLAPTIYLALLVTSQQMVRDVILKRLSGPRGAPGILGVVTGGARRSMVGFAGQSGDTLWALLGSALNYVKAHEEGFKGTEHVRAYERRRLGKIRAVSSARETRGQVTRRSAPTAAQRRAGPIHVRAFDRKVNIVAKHFIRDTVREAEGPTSDRVLRGLQILASTGRLPTARELGA